MGEQLWSDQADQFLCAATDRFARSRLFCRSLSAIVLVNEGTVSMPGSMSDQRCGDDQRYEAEQQTDADNRNH